MTVVATEEHRKISREAKRSVGIDLIRAASVMYIVGYWHLIGYTNDFIPVESALTSRVTLIILGLFVFISGHLMGKKEIPLEKEYIFAFCRKRIMRIYPLYFVAILLFWLLSLSDGPTLVKAAVLSSMLIGPAPLTLWFMTMIILYYFSVPFLSYLSHDYRKLIVFCLAITIAALVYHKVTNMLDIRAVLFFPVFALGIYTAKIGPRLFADKMLHLVVICLFSWLLSFLPVGSWMISQLILVPMITFCALFVFLIVQSWESRISYAAIIQLLGYSSYCIYLFHRPLYKTMKLIYFPEGALNQFAYLYLLCLPLTIGISFLVQKGYDQLLTPRAIRAEGSSGI